MYRFINDSSLRWFAAAMAATTSVLVILILFFLGKESTPAIASIGIERFFSDSSWHPETHAGDGLFNLLPIIIGSILTSGLALCIALPIGVLLALFGEFYAPRLVDRFTTRFVELLAGIPSVVLGLWGLVVLVPIIQHYRNPGVSILAAALVLAIMILPLIALSSRSALKSVSKDHQKSAAALGLSRGTMILTVALPLAKSGIAVGVLLAAARAIGETMVVVMLCGNVAKIPGSVFDSARTLTATIALEMGYSFGAHRSALFFVGLLLMCSVLLILTVIHYSGAKQRHV